MSVQTTRYISRDRAFGLLMKNILSASDERLGEILDLFYRFDNFQVGYDTKDDDYEF